MKYFACALISIVLDCAAARSQERSPVVNADHTVTFSLNAPNAQSVVLSGDMVKGRLPLQKESDGTWRVTTGPIDRGVYFYRFIVDGLMTVDPKNTRIEPYYELSNVLEVRDGKPFVYDLSPDVPHGQIRLETFTSKLLGRVVQFYVYTPPGYESGQKQYPVLYELHGAPGFPGLWQQINSSSRVLDNLHAAGRAPAMILVIPTAEIEPFFPFPRPSEPAYDAALAGLKTFEAYFLHEFMPWFEARYRTRRDRESRWLSGYSLGGIEAFHVGVRHPELFSVVRVASTGFLNGGLLTAGLESVYPELKHSEQLNRQLRLFYFSCGTADGALPQMQRAHEALQGLGVRHEYVESGVGGGTHTGASAQEAFAAFVERLNALGPR